MIILSIETSCDETAAAIVKFEGNKAEILSSVISSQIKMHSKYGGVVPSLASRLHLKNIVPVLKKAFRDAKTEKEKIDFIAVTSGPGLIPALMVGVSAAKALSYKFGKPLFGIHHVEGHIYANWLKDKKGKKYSLWNAEFPVLCLTVSGGHTQLVLMKKDLDYNVIGETVDDAAGEAFDKVAKLLGLGYPGGPLIEKIAEKGNEKRFRFTRPMINSRNFDFSFSGLKTAVLYETMSANKEKNEIKYKQDMAASFQQAVIDVLVSKTIRAAKKYKVKNILIGGGVSRNAKLKKQFFEEIKKEAPGIFFHFPLSEFTTDNAVMIAVAAYKHAIKNKKAARWEKVSANANLILK